MATFENKKPPLTIEQRTQVMVDMIVNGVKQPSDLYTICKRFIQSRDDEVKMQGYRVLEALEAEVQTRAADKAEKLQELGYGQPPILFETKEILEVIKKHKPELND
jgi:septum formation topological specificity factor MinE